MSGSQKRFSIILAAYNVEKYIGEALKSVINQTYENYEIIVVDDCSTDDTMKVVKQYNDKRIKVYSTKANTKTAGAPRNIGLQHAKGEYILFLDGDDRLYNNKVLEKINKLIGNDVYDILYLGYQDMGNGDKLRMSNDENSTKKARILCDVTFSVSSRCWNREFINRNNMRFIESMYYEDEVFTMTANILVEKTICGDFPIFYYRRNRKGSVMTTPTIKKCSDFYRALAAIVDLIEITPEKYKPYLLSFIKNESEIIPLKVKAILKSLIHKTGTPVFPKREFDYDDFMEEIFNSNNSLKN